MPSWVGSNQPMKMRETSRAMDKKPQVNNNLKKKPELREDMRLEFFRRGKELGTREVMLDYVWNVQFATQFGLNQNSPFVVNL